MRGTVSPKLTDFLALANSNIALAKQNNVQFTPTILRENLEKLGALMSDSPEVSYIADKMLTLPDHTIPVRIYSPAPDKPLPVLLHFTLVVEHLANDLDFGTSNRYQYELNNGRRLF